MFSNREEQSFRPGMLARSVAFAGALGFGASAIAAEWPSYYPAEYADTVEACKQEDSSLLVYSIMAQYNWAPVLEEFKKLYPWLEVNTLDLNSSETFTRYYAERSSGAETTDLIVSANVDGWLQFFDKGAAMPYTSPEDEKLPDWSKPHEGVYTVSTTPFTIVYNKLLVPEEKRPRSIQHLAQLVQEYPEFFKESLTTYNVELSPFSQAIHLAYLDKTGEVGQKALDVLWEETRPEMSAGPMLAKIASGEYKIAYFGSGVVVFPQATGGVNSQLMGYTFPEDAVPVFQRLMAIPEGAPSPNCAKLLLDFILSHAGQAAFGRGGLTPYRPGVTKDEVAFHTLDSLKETVGEDKISFIDHDPAMLEKVPALVERWKQITQD